MTTGTGMWLRRGGQAIGRDEIRSDGQEKVRGEAIYTMDHVEAGMLYGAVLRSPVASARILRLDTSRAESMPGVHATASHHDAPHLSGMVVVKDQSTFAGTAIRYVGEPIAAVAATSPEKARAALMAIDLELENTPPVLDFEKALDADSPLIHPDWKTYETSMPGTRQGNLTWENRLRRGSDDDFAAAFASAHTVVEDTVRVPRQNQTPIEPHVAVASFRNGRYTVHTSTQFPYMIRARTAELLGVRESAVRVIVPTVGGGFGGKLDAILEPIACILARKSKRPVQVLNSRAEEFATTGCRENAVVKICTALSAEGLIVAQEALVIADNGANSSGETVMCAGVAPIALGATYRIPMARYTSQVVYTNTPPTAAFRGVNGPYCIFAVETHMDHIARVIGMDRREFRQRHVLHKGESMVNGQVLTDAFLEEALDSVERRIPWRSTDDEPTIPGRLRGKAIVPLSWLTNAGPGDASVRLTEDGTVMITCAATEIGTGAVATGIRQIVAEVIGLPVADVLAAAPDTDAGGYDHGAQGSRTTFGMGNAAGRAATEVRAQILSAAGSALEIDAESLELFNGVVRAGDGRSMTLSEVAGHAMWATGPISATGRFVAIPAKYDADSIEDTAMTTFAGVSYHAHYAEVEVDPVTGTVEVLRYVVAQDVGRAINPAMIRGQVNGAVAQGLGYALFEEVRIDSDGRVLDQGFETYRVPTVFDLPDIDLEILENACEQGPYGAKGAAEPPIVPAAAVIACAVSDAIGQPLGELPITPFAVLDKLRRAREGKDCD